MTNRILRRCLVSIVLAGVLAASAGCGQKGDLYLPDEPERKEDFTAIPGDAATGERHA